MIVYWVYRTYSYTKFDYSLNVLQLTCWETCFLNDKSIEHDLLLKQILHSIIALYIGNGVFDIISNGVGCVENDTIHTWFKWKDKENWELFTAHSSVSFQYSRNILERDSCNDFDGKLISFRARIRYYTVKMQQDTIYRQDNNRILPPLRSQCVSLPL